MRFADGDHMCVGGMCVMAPRCQPTACPERFWVTRAAPWAYRLVDGEGQLLGRIPVPAEEPRFGPLAPTYYLRRS